MGRTARCALAAFCAFRTIGVILLASMNVGEARADPFASGGTVSVNSACHPADAFPTFFGGIDIEAGPSHGFLIDGLMEFSDDLGVLTGEVGTLSALCVANTTVVGAAIFATWAIAWEMDPFLSYDITLASNVDLHVEFTAQIVITPIHSTDVVTTDLEITLEDLVGDGTVNFVAGNGPSIGLQTAVLGPGGELGGLGFGTFTQPGTFTFSAGPALVPAPPPGQQFVNLGLFLTFDVGAGDLVTLSGQVNVVPEPSVALLLACGLHLLSRRTRPA